MPAFGKNLNGATTRRSVSNLNGLTGGVLRHGGISAVMIRLAAQQRKSAVQLFPKNDPREEMVKRPRRDRKSEMFSDLPESVSAADDKSHVPRRVPMSRDKGGERSGVKRPSLLSECYDKGTGRNTACYLRRFLGDAFSFPQFDDIKVDHGRKPLSIETLHLPEPAAFFQPADRKKRYLHGTTRTSRGSRRGASRQIDSMS